MFTMARWVDALSLTAHGLSAKQVANSMSITQNAVVKHLERARVKLAAKTTTEAVYKAAKAGLIMMLMSASVNNCIHDAARISRRAPLSRTARPSPLRSRELRL